MHDQSTHDGRYHQAIKAKVRHNRAWNEEKKRRRAALDAAMKERDYRRQRIALDQQWHEEFDDELQEGDFVPTASNPAG
eukprot:11178185-Karenia_brevis.AAC.1